MSSNNVVRQQENTIPIAVDYVKCQGLENTLKECVQFSHSYGCSHDEDVGVRCQPGKEMGQIPCVLELQDTRTRPLLLITANYY